MKKLNFKKLIALGLTAAAAVASFTACSTNATSGGNDGNTGSKVYRTLDEIKASGKINIGVFSDKNPFGYVDENGEYQGYDIYFANRLGKDLGVEINYVSTEAANRVEYLETGKVDIILANFTVTEERAEKVDFALPYMNVALGVVSPDSNVITSLDNWKAEDKMIVISGTTAELYLTKNYPDIKLQKYDSYATAKSAIENGNGVAWANDNTEVIAYDGKEFCSCPIRARNLSGRTGRGDTTFAAYMTERLHHSMKDALLYATATVSNKMEIPGPYKGTRADVDKYIEEFYSDIK